MDPRIHDPASDEAILDAIATVETIDLADTIELTPAQIRAAILLSDRAAVEARFGQVVA